MQLEKITEADLENKGVTVLPNVPGLEYKEMQYKFEEILRDVVIPKFNAAIDEINSVIFNDPSGSAYLTNKSITPTLDAISREIDPTKVPSSLAIKEMRTLFESIMDPFIQIARLQDVNESDKYGLYFVSTRRIPDDAVMVEHGHIYMKKRKGVNDCSWYNQWLHYAFIGKQTQDGDTIYSFVSPDVTSKNLSLFSKTNVTYGGDGMAIRAYVKFKIGNAEYISYTPVIMAEWGDGFGGNIPVGV